MANTRELRRRIKSVKNTSQITKAMQMVAATKMRRAQNQAVNSRPYSENMSVSLHNLVTSASIEEHPLSRENDSKNIAVILLTTDKSLCGALNTNLFRAVNNFNTPNHQYITVGKKGRDFIVKTGRDLLADFENPEKVGFEQAVQIAKLITDSFLDGSIKEASIVYPHFISTLTQEPRIVKLLPINSSVISNVKEKSSNEISQSKNLRDDNTRDFIFEPSSPELLGFVLIHFIQTKIYAALLETKASEHAARMIAMQNATNNAKDLVDDLNLTYNQIRQDSITQELLEITSAGAALE